MAKVETDELAIATVNGAKVRIVPLVVRKPERRVSTVDLAPGCKVKVTLLGEIGPGGEVVLADNPVKVDKGLPLAPSDSIPVTYLGKTIMSVGKKRVSMVERRSGSDRRVAP